MVKTSIPNIVLAGLLGAFTAMTSVAGAAEPEAAESVGSPPSAAPQRAQITIEEAPGADLPPQIAADVRAVVEDMLAGRAAPGVPIDITLEPGGAVVRVGSLWRRIAIAGWDYPAMRTVALHVLDLLQPAPDVPEVTSATRSAGPAASVVAVAPAGGRAAEHGTDSPGEWSFHAGVAGGRGAQLP